MKLSIGNSPLRIVAYNALTSKKIQADKGLCGSEVNKCLLLHVGLPLTTPVDPAIVQFVCYISRLKLVWPNMRWSKNTQDRFHS